MDLISSTNETFPRDCDSPDGICLPGQSNTIVTAATDIATIKDDPITTAATIFTRPSPAPTSTTSYPILTPPALSAKALGTVEDCDKYRNAFTYDWGDLDETNSCDMWAWWYEISLQDLLRRNPSLRAENCILEPGKSYCVLKCMLLRPFLATPNFTDAVFPSSSFRHERHHIFRLFLIGL
jgi:hypothetical protein